MSSEVAASNSSLASSKSDRRVSLPASCQQPGSSENWQCWHLPGVVGSIKQMVLSPPAPQRILYHHLLARGEKGGSGLVPSTIMCVGICCNCSLTPTHAVCLLISREMWFLSVGALLILGSPWYLPQTALQTPGMRYSVFNLRNYVRAACQVLPECLQ